MLLRRTFSDRAGTARTTRYLHRSLRSAVSYSSQTQHIIIISLACPPRTHATLVKEGLDRNTVMVTFSPQKISEGADAATRHLHL